MQNPEVAGRLHVIPKLNAQSSSRLHRAKGTNFQQDFPSYGDPHFRPTGYKFKGFYRALGVNNMLVFTELRNCYIFILSLKVTNKSQ